MSEELTPMNHRELWLKAIATGTVPEWLEPMTHEELWLKAIAQGGGSDGGGGDIKFITSNELKNSPKAQEVYADLIEHDGDWHWEGYNHKWLIPLAHSVAVLYGVNDNKIGASVTEMMNKTKLQYQKYSWTWDSTTLRFGSFSTTNEFYTMTPD
jgi:hypothetical protein